MHPLSINELFLGRAVTALCWTLFHSLWQGLIAAVFAALLLIRTKRSRPTVRYNVLSALFLLLTFLFAATFLYELQHSGEAAGGRPASGGEVTMLIQNPDHPAGVRAGGQLSPINTISGFLSRNSVFIVTIWLIILSLKMARMLFVLGYTRHIIRRKTHEPPLYWRQRITILCHQLGITKPVRLLESKIVKLPVVFGQLKPVILVPLGLLAQLAPGQVEAILLHEVAHIRRNDYLVNLLQNIIETLFFFNPALLWLSSLIRDERENCCDDVAIDQLKSRKQYVESLISFKERAIISSPLSAVGFAGRKNSFINRVSRIVENKNYTLSRFEKGSLACSSLVAASLALAVVVPGGTGLIKPAPQFAQIKTMSPQPMVVLSRYTDTLISAERLTSTIWRKARAEAGHGIMKTDSIKIHTDTIKIVWSSKARDTIPQPPPPAQPEDHSIIRARMHQVIADLARENVVPDSAAVESFALDDHILTVNDQPQSEALHEKLKLKYNIRDLGLYYGPGTHGHGYVIHERPSLPPPPPIQPKRPFHGTETLESILGNVTDDLIAEGIVKDNSDPVAFLLTNRELVVNGQLQPESVHEKLKEKYISANRYTLEPRMTEDPDFGLHYNSKTGSMGLGIHHWADNQMP
jgi:beta-lactamase regulating signal transducer with metallopeptidase domain